MPLYRRIIPLLLICILIYSGVAVHVVHVYRHYRLKKEVKHLLMQNLPDSSLELFVLNPGQELDLNWIKKGKEFRYNGKMFDVVRRKKSGDKLLLYCYNDSKETLLMDELNRLMKDLDDSSSDTAKNAKKASYLLFAHNTLGHTFYSEGKELLFVDIQALYNFDYIKDIAHPPDQLA